MRAWFLLIIITILLAFAIIHKKNEKNSATHISSNHRLINDRNESENHGMVKNDSVNALEENLN